MPRCLDASLLWCLVALVPRCLDALLSWCRFDSRIFLHRPLSLVFLVIIVHFILLSHLLAISCIPLSAFLSFFYLWTFQWLSCSVKSIDSRQVRKILGPFFVIVLISWGCCCCCCCFQRNTTSLRTFSFVSDVLPLLWELVHLSLAFCHFSENFFCCFLAVLSGKCLSQRSGQSCLGFYIL